MLGAFSVWASDDFQTHAHAGERSETYNGYKSEE